MKNITLLLSSLIGMVCWFGDAVSAQVAVPVWTNLYNGPSNSHDVATAIAVDDSGNVVVTGYSDSNGFNTNCDYATIKYSSAGVPLWTNRYAGSGGLSDVPAAIAADHNDNVFVTGSSYVQGSPTYHGTSYRYATVAYSSGGVPLWTNLFRASGNGDARAVSVATDSANVFVTGNSIENTNNYGNMTTIAYSSAGVPLWTNRYQGPGLGGTSGATGMALDRNGNVFVTGYSYGTDGYQHYATLAYSSAGTPLWTNQYIGPQNISDGAAAVAVDRGGNVFVTGLSYGTNGFYDCATLAYSSAGVPLWTNRYATGNGSAVKAMALDSSGNVFVTGYSWNTVGFPDYATVAYSAGGIPLWTNRYDGPVNRDDGATAVAVDGRGNVFVAGYSTGTYSNYDYVTIAYSSSGNPSWTNRYSGEGNGHDRAAAIAVDGSGNVFVTGYSTGSSSGSDYATIRYSIVPTIPLEIQLVENQLVLSWTNTAFTLQTALAITGTFTNIPGVTSPYTNPITGAQQFFRLMSN
jgi:hypothetical protein